MSILVALALQQASAFSPENAVLDGESLEPQRIQTYRQATQARYLRSPAWQRFVQGDGAGWRAMFDEHTGIPRTMWGGGVRIRTQAGADVVAQDVAAWLERQSDLLGFEAGTLAIRSANYNEGMDVWYVDFDVLREGLPTYRGGISARVKAGNLILLQVSTAPQASVRGGFVLTADQALQRAITDGPAPNAKHEGTSVEAMLLDQKAGQGHQLRKTWMVRTRTAEPPGIWVSFIDGETGALLSVHNEVRFIDGVVEGQHHPRTVNQALITSPLPLAIVQGDSNSDVTDDNGVYTVNAGSEYVTTLNGTYVDVRNSAGAEGTLLSSNPNLLWTTSDATQSEIDVYTFTHHVKAWGAVAAPDVPIVNQKLVANVNINNACNAFYDGSMNFYRAGSGCNNTGEIADVVYHEWGHGFHFSSLEAGFFDGSLSEGASDTVAFLLTDDPDIAPFFRTNGGAIRNVSLDRIYPADFSNSPYAVHSNGLIFGGTMWDLWRELRDLEGDTIGTVSTEQIFTGLLKGGTDIPGTWGEALVADDDDGDLSNGTPHICTLYTVFGAHGLGPGDGETPIFPSHEPLVDVAAGADFDVAVELLEVQPGCTAGDIDDASVTYRVNGGPWESSPLTATGTSGAEGAIPVQPPGSFVEYYIEGTESEGRDFSTPPGGEIAPYTFVVGDTLAIRCQGFESGDGGYTSELLQGDNVEGANDWQWGSPNGESSDPSAAFGGTLVWGNDLGAENFNGAYQPNRGNALTSRTIPTGHYTDVFLQYRRWLSIEDATFDNALILANDQQVWSNFEGSGDEHHIDTEWIHHVVDLGGVADQSEVTVRWELYSDAGLEFGGWTIDDVCIMAPATADNRLGIVNFTAEAVGDVDVSLSWTNPQHAPVESVRVVRRFDRFPAGPEDGDLVVEVESPVLGGTATFSELNFQAGTSFYAAYGFDGTDWLSWTVEGFNAASVDLVGGEAPPGWPTDNDGDGRVDPYDPVGELGQLCGCSGSGTRGATPLVLLALGLLIRRRQR